VFHRSKLFCRDNRAATEIFDKRTRFERASFASASVPGDSNKSAHEKIAAMHL